MDTTYMKKKQLKEHLYFHSSYTIKFSYEYKLTITTACNYLPYYDFTIYYKQVKCSIFNVNITRS